jgi:hypothetical protein
MVVLITPITFFSPFYNNQVENTHIGVHNATLGRFPVLSSALLGLYRNLPYSVAGTLVIGQDTCFMGEPCLSFPPLNRIT